MKKWFFLLVLISFCIFINGNREKPTEYESLKATYERLNLDPYVKRSNLVSYVEYVNEFFGFNIIYDVNQITYEEKEPMETLEAAQELLKLALSDGFTVYNQCVADKIILGNDNIVFLPKSVWLSGQGIATTYEEDIDYTTYYTINGDERMHMSTKRIRYINTIFIPQHLKYSELVLANSLIHEYVHQCDFALHRRKRITLEELDALHQTKEGYIKMELEAHVLEARFFEYLLKNNKLKEHVYTYHDIKSLANTISTYREYKKDNLRNDLEYKYVGRFGQNKKP
ncbi:hypothetical protein ACFL2U_01715 [Patescibacteria group bacterium]